MRKLIFFIIFCLFIINRDGVVIGASEALNIWSSSVFPLLYPTFIISDLLLSTGIINIISEYLGVIFGKIFKVSNYGFYIILISMLSGTPTNVKNLLSLYNKNIINEEDLVKILGMSYFFNPFFIISMTSLKILIIMWLSNLICGFILRNYKVSKNSNKFFNINYDFNINDSIKNNMNLLLNILGVLVVYSVLSNILHINNIYIITLVTGLLEVTNGLYRINFNFHNNEYLQILIISLGGLSILTQIKSILKDTNIDYKYLLLTRIISAFIGLTICFLT